MAILTRPATVQKGVPGAFTLNRVELAALPAITDAYYQDSNNWAEVHVQFKHTESNQKGLCIFKAGSDTTNFATSDSSRSGNWEVQKIMLRDYDKGSYLIQRAGVIAQAPQMDFIVVSNATHGDIYVPAGQTVEIPSGGKRQYGDLIVEAGGTLKLAAGGGITELEVTQNCIINGIIDCQNGNHTGGTWNATSVLGENLSHTVTQKAGGAGGQGEDYRELGPHLLSNSNFDSGMTSYETAGTHDGLSGVNLGTGQWVRQRVTVTPGKTYQIDASFNIPSIFFQVLRGADYSGLPGGGTITGQGFFTATESDIWVQLQNSNVLTANVDYIYLREVTSGGAGGLGGAAASGNGAGGGRSAKFVSMPGGDADAFFAGNGAGSLDKADALGEDGADSLSASQAGGGGFRGAHGQALYLKARKIQGSGSIIASGKKGGNGGAGNEYLSEGLLYGNGSGGGGAGGDAGNIWIRYQQGSVGLTTLVAAGERGTAGATAPDTVPGSHGVAGSAGTVDIAQY